MDGCCVQPVVFPSTPGAFSAAMHGTGREIPRSCSSDTTLGQMQPHILLEIECDLLYIARHPLLAQFDSAPGSRLYIPLTGLCSSCACYPPASLVEINGKYLVPEISIPALVLLLVIIGTMSDSYRSTFTGSSYSDNHYGENDRRSDRDVKYYSNDGFTVEPDLPVPSRAVADTDSTWKPSKMIHVRFLGGTREHRDIATRVAAEFQRIANIHFRFMSAVDPRQADVRISFASADGYWSYIGTQALQIPAHKPTMNLGFTRNMSEEQMMGKARHEFGHLAGLVHEHQHPDGPQFKANKARDFFSRRGIKHDFDFQVMNKHTGSHYRKGEYDPDSVMHYEVPEHITKDGTSVGVNNQLSRGDKKMLQELYPRNSQKPRPADEKGENSSTHRRDTPSSQIFKKKRS